jgi:DNA polymerase-3 subunit delta
MPFYSRDDLPQLLQQAATAPTQVFLLFGERYLCQNATEQLERVLLQGAGGTVHPIDGDQEDISATLGKLRSFSLFPGRQIYRVTDTRLFLSKQLTKSIWERAVKAHAAGKAEQAGRALRALLSSAGLDPQAQDNGLENMAATEWQQCFGFAHPGTDLSWTRGYLENGNKRGASAKSASDPADMLIAVLASGLPPDNCLILLCEELDKRKKLFKLLKDDQSVVDLSIEAGAGAKAQKEQKGVLNELLRSTLAEQGKTLGPGLGEILFDRVGFHPVALVMELRKLMAYLGERKQITRADVDVLVGRTRQEALFELTAALGQRNREQALIIAERVQENGIHPLAIIATLRNFVRGLLLCRALLEQPTLGYQATMNPAAFQQSCLPRLKEMEQWKRELGGHPFALYMQFKTAASFPLPTLIIWMQHLLRAELRLKGSPVTAGTVVQWLILAMLAG